MSLVPLTKSREVSEDLLQIHKRLFFLWQIYLSQWTYWFTHRSSLRKKSKADLIQGWLEKAWRDLQVAFTDIICFHAQQAAE